MESDKKTTSDRTFVSISDHLKNAATWVPVQVKVSALEKTKHIIVVVIRKSHNISMQKYYNLIVKMTKVGCLIPLEVTLTLKKKHDKYHPTQTHQRFAVLWPNHAGSSQSVGQSQNDVYTI